MYYRTQFIRDNYGRIEATVVFEETLATTYMFSKLAAALMAGGESPIIRLGVAITHPDEMPSKARGREVAQRRCRHMMRLKPIYLVANKGGSHLRCEVELGQGKKLYASYNLEPDGKLKLYFTDLMRE